MILVQKFSDFSSVTLLHDCLIDSTGRNAYENPRFGMVKCLIVEKFICFRNSTCGFEYIEHVRVHAYACVF